MYALERLPDPAAVAILDAVVERLDERARPLDGGLAWESPWERRTLSAERGRDPEGAYNVGVAHGVPGVAGLLAGALHAGAGAQRILPLLEGAVEWTLAQQRDEGAASRFPYWMTPGVETSSDGRTAWCYGDAGVAAVLDNAGRVAGVPRWRAAARAVALEAAERTAEQAGVHDASLCHGSAGLAHIFGRLHESTGEPAWRPPPSAGFEWTIDACRTDDGDFEVRWATAAGDERRDRSFLTGETGVALALLAAATPVAPDWDRLLLLSL